MLYSVVASRRQPILYEHTFRYLTAESARLVHPWHFRGSHFDTASVHYLRYGPAFFDLLLHLIYFFYKSIYIYIYRFLMGIILFTMTLGFEPAKMRIISGQSIYYKKNRPQ